ncbi:hypothetical protein MferCBS31731_004574 [Microsporum ferrugineum]
MSLLDLPSEILLWVLECLGASFFRDDIGRLTVCKRWYGVAHHIFYADIELQAGTLSKLFAHPSLPTRAHLFKHSLKILTVELRGFMDWNRVCIQDLDDGNIQPYIDSWTSSINNNLSKLAAYIHEGKVLRTLRFTAWSEFTPIFPTLPRRDYLYFDTIFNFLSLDSLTVLELDTCGSHFIHYGVSQSQSGRQRHICQHIAALLPQLHCLRLRLREICPLALQPQGADTPYLKSVIVNLSLSNEPSDITSASYSRRCGSSERPGFPQLRSDMEDQATRLAGQMSYPVIVRVLFHPHNGCSSLGWKQEYLDVLTGKRATLEPSIPWDEDGETEPEDSEEESDTHGTSPGSDS